MRVISGFLKGRKLLGYNITGTRPTMDRVKESVFGSIQNYVGNSIVLDLFSGSGSLGIEAISNGAKYCYFTDNNKEILKILKNNIDSFKINDKADLIYNDYNNSLIYFKNNNIKFDLVFIDPPYKYNVIEEIINKLLNYNLLNDEAIIVCEYSSDLLKDSYNNLNLLKYKKFGDTHISIYKYSK